MQKLIYVTTALFLFCIAQSTTALAQTNSGISSDAHIVNQDFVEAEVLFVKPNKRTITVKGEQKGQIREFTVPEGVRVTVNGKEARLRDLRRGDNIMIKFAQSTDKVVVDRIRVPTTPITLVQRRANPVVEAQPAMLPSTASILPAFLLLGLVSLAGAALIRRNRA